MVDYSGTGPNGAFEGHTTISNGAFKGVTGSAFYLYLPLQITGSAPIRDSTDGNKTWIEPYNDTNHAKDCLGVGWYNKAAKPSDEEALLGAGQSWRRRDISILHEGVVPMIFVSGATKSKTEYGMRIAPDQSGFIEWGTGMANMGFVLDPGVGTGEQCRVRVWTYKPEVDYF